MAADSAQATEYDWSGAYSESLRSLDHRELSVSDLDAIIGVQKQYNSTLADDDDIRGHVGGLSNRQVVDFAQELTDRLQEETTVLDSLLSEDLQPFIEDLKDTRVPFPVIYVSAEQLQRMNNYPKRTNACYSGGTIFIGGDLPDLRERIVTFATRGILTNDLFHEIYHGFQDAELRFDSMEELLQYITDPRPAEWQLALAESHAWMSCLPAFKDEVLIPVIRKSYAIENSHFLEVAFDTVRALHALGLTDREIGKLISQARWDEQTKSYGVLREEIERLARLHGHSLAEMEDLVEKHKMMQRAQALRGMAVAAEMCHVN